MALTGEALSDKPLVFGQGDVSSDQLAIGHLELLHERLDDLVPASDRLFFEKGTDRVQVSVAQRRLLSGQL